MSCLTSVHMRKKKMTRQKDKEEPKSYLTGLQMKP